LTVPRARLPARRGTAAGRVSVSIFTQLSDVENECDGLFNMDRSAKFSPAQTQQVINANRALINQ
jgi:hypothetical protein